MKKIAVTITAVAMLLAMASCGGDTSTTSSKAGTASTASVESISSINTVSIPPVSSEIVDEGPENLSYTGTAIDNNDGLADTDEGFMPYYEGNVDGYGPTLLNDGDLATGWQLKSTEVRDEEYDGTAETPVIKDGYYVGGDGNSYQMQTYDFKAWVGIKLAAAAKVDLVVVDFEAGSVPQTFENGGYKLQYTVDGTEWTDVADATYTRGELDAVAVNTYADTISFTAIEGVTGFRVIIDKCTTKYAPKVWEIEVYAVEEEETSSEASSEPASDAE